MKVKDLIEFLQSIENKELSIYLYDYQDIIPLKMDMFDLDVKDRIDINLPSEQGLTTPIFYDILLTRY